MFVVGLIKSRKNQIVIWMCKIIIPQNLHSRFMFKIHIFNRGKLLYKSTNMTKSQKKEITPDIWIEEHFKIYYLKK